MRKLNIKIDRNYCMTLDNQPCHCLNRKHDLLNMISKISATHNTMVITVKVYIAMRKIVFSKCSGTMHFTTFIFLPRDSASHKYRGFTWKPKR